MRFADCALDACDGADAMRRRLRQPLVFDGRNLYDPAHVAAEGIDDRPVGRRPVPTGPRGNRSVDRGRSALRASGRVAAADDVR